MTASKRYLMFVLIVLGLAAGHQLTQKYFELSLPVLHSYLDDVLAMPILLAIWRWERHYWWGIPKLKPTDILFFTIMISLLFELLLPYCSPAYTADWRDGIAYGAGSALFYWFQPA